MVWELVLVTTVVVFFINLGFINVLHKLDDIEQTIKKCSGHECDITVVEMETEECE